MLQPYGMMSVRYFLMSGWILHVLRRVLVGGSKGLLPTGGAGGCGAGVGGSGGCLPERGSGALRRVKSLPPFIFMIMVAHSGQVVGSRFGADETIFPWEKWRLCMNTAHMIAARVVGATLAFAISGHLANDQMRSDLRAK